MFQFSMFENCKLANLLKIAKLEIENQKIMGKKIFVLLAVAALIAATAQGITLKEFSQKPLPSVIEFMDKAIDWLSWFWSKIVYYANIVLNWSLDVALVKTWKFFLWLWGLIKAGIMNGWNLIDQIIQQLASGSGINWQNIQWPWNEQ